MDSWELGIKLDDLISVEFVFDGTWPGSFQAFFFKIWFKMTHCAMFLMMQMTSNKKADDVGRYIGTRY